MNERIRELHIQAQQHAFNEPIDIENCTVEDIKGFSQQVYEKFAELIVRECAEQIIAKGTDWVDFAPSQTGVRPEYWDMAQQIKEHFGVKSND